jgi:HD superfamily phosphodiesterase
LLLNEKQAKLFFSMPLYEQRHALRVCRTLCAAGYGGNLPLLRAALLHDLGKSDPESGRSVTLWGKAANVAIAKIGGEALVKKLASNNPANWRYVFWLQTQHEQRGQELAREAGSEGRVLELLGYKSGEADPYAVALKWADDLN